MHFPTQGKSLSRIAAIVTLLSAAAPVFEASAIGLSDYNLFARDTLMVRDRPRISGGYIGANRYSELGNDAILNGNLRCRRNARLLDRARVEGNVMTGGTLTLGSGATVTGTITQHATVDSIPIPTKSFSYGSADVTVNAGQTITLAPGPTVTFTLTLIPE
jgi:predicted acyltransferase (DUF342 family)